MNLLDESFKDMTDEDLILHLSTSRSLRSFAESGMDYFGPTRNHHQPILYYLSVKRASLITMLHEECRQLAAEWPANHQTLRARVRVGGWWGNAIQRHFREALRERMRRKSTQDWVDLIWTVVPSLLEKYPIPPVPSRAESEIYKLIRLPSEIHFDWEIIPVEERQTTRGPAPRKFMGPNLTNEIRKELRHRLRREFGLPER